jgi:hypothetical protein
MFMEELYTQFIAKTTLMMEFYQVFHHLNEPRSLNMNPYPDCPRCPADSMNFTNVVYSCSFRLVIEWVLLQVFLQTIPVLPL